MCKVRETISNSLMSHIHELEDISEAGGMLGVHPHHQPLIVQSGTHADGFNRETYMRSAVRCAVSLRQLYMGVYRCELCSRLLW